MFADNNSGKWNFDGSAKSSGFNKSLLNSISEPWHYKVRGEHSILKRSYFNGFNGDKAIGLNLTPDRENPKVDWNESISDDKNERLVRSNTILSITNDELLNANQNPVINLLKTEEERFINRPAGHHIAGYITTNDDGLRYVYAIPVYNNEKQEVILVACSILE